MKIVFASNNTGKIQEVQAYLPVVAQKELGIKEIEETQSTFVENALLKARHAAEMSGLPALADDSGLLVPFLQGDPGIYSARYAGKEASMKDNIQKLLAELANTTQDQREAYFYCVIVFLRHAKDPVPLICEGEWHGVISTEPLGENGFGYDPIFFDPVYQCTAAQMPFALKNKISHRAKALGRVSSIIIKQL